MATSKTQTAVEAEIEEFDPEIAPGLGARIRAHRLAWAAALVSTALFLLVLVSPQMQQGGFYEGLFGIAAILSILRGLGKI